MKSFHQGNLRKGLTILSGTGIDLVFIGEGEWDEFQKKNRRKKRILLFLYLTDETNESTLSCRILLHILKYSLSLRRFVTRKEKNGWWWRWWSILTKKKYIYQDEKMMNGFFAKINRKANTVVFWLQEEFEKKRKKRLQSSNNGWSFIPKRKGNWRNAHRKKGHISHFQTSETQSNIVKGKSCYTFATKSYTLREKCVVRVHSFHIEKPSSWLDPCWIRNIKKYTFQNLELHLSKMHSKMQGRKKYLQTKCCCTKKLNISVFCPFKKKLF